MTVKCVNENCPNFNIEVTIPLEEGMSDTVICCCGLDISNPA